MTHSVATSWILLLTDLQHIDKQKYATRHKNLLFVSCGWPKSQDLIVGRHQYEIKYTVFQSSVWPIPIPIFSYIYIIVFTTFCHPKFRLLEWAFNSLAVSKPEY